MSLRDKDALYATKEEVDATNTSATASSSRQWSSGLKNPRIVRVSRTFGGKDRHSKVCTIKGLRDRRIRLSVPTAIQLYDLQDRLNLGQPSKVIDWLLDTTKDDIDKLPPLPGMPGSFAPYQQSMYASQGYNGMSLSSSNPFIDEHLIPSRREGGININSQSVDMNEDDPSIVAKLKYWDSNATMRSKQKEIGDEQGTIGEHSSGNSQVLAQNFFPIASGNNATILPPSNFLSNHHPMYNYYHHWDPSHLSLTQLGNLGLSSQNDHHHQGQSSNSGSLPSPLALSSRSHLFPSPSMTSTSSIFPQHASFLSTSNPQFENDIRQFNRSHMSNTNPYTTSPLYTSSGLGLKPFPFSMGHHPHLHQSDHHHHDKDDDEDDGPWKGSSRN